MTKRVSYQEEDNLININGHRHGAFLLFSSSDNFLHRVATLNSGLAGLSLYNETSVNEWSAISYH